MHTTLYFTCNNGHGAWSNCIAEYIAFCPATGDNLVGFKVPDLKDFIIRAGFPLSFTCLLVFDNDCVSTVASYNGFSRN